MTINTVIFSGNLGNACITRSTTNGKLITTFSLAVTQGFGASKKISWVECGMFGAKAEKLAIYLKKGTKVTVAGQLLIDKWTGKDGKEKTTVVILINDIYFSGRQENQSQQPRNIYDEEIPF